MEELALRTWVEVEYSGKNITADVSKDLVSFSFTDNESGTADDIDITLKNEHGRWSDQWMPTLGDKMKLTIHQQGRGAGFSLPCGTFTLDSFVDSDSNGATVSFKGQSIPTKNGIKTTTKSRSWEQVKLSEIAGDIALEAGLRLTYATVVDPLYDVKSQTNMTNISFLNKICKEEALNLKVTDEQIVIFDPQEMDKKSPIKTFVRGFDKITGRSFTTQNHDTYSESTVEYDNPKTGKKESYTEKSDRIKDSKKLNTVTRAKSKAEAQRLAKAKLYEANSKETTGSMTVVGDTRLVAGEIIELIGFGKFDGTYKISKVTHIIGSGGYTSSLELNSTNNPVKEPKTEAKKKEKVATKKKAERKKVVKKAKVSTKKTSPTIKKNLNEDEIWIMSQK